MPRSARTRRGRQPSSATWSATCSAIRRWARWRSPNRNWRSPASRARRSSRPTASASAFPRAPASIRYGASRFLTDMQRNADLKQASNGDIHASSDFLVQPSGDARPRAQRARQCPPIQQPRHGRARPQRIFGILDGMVYGEDPSEGFVRGRHFLHPKLGFTFTAPPGFTLDNTAQAVLGSRMAAARRCASTSSACRPSRRCPII